MPRHGNTWIRVTLGSAAADGDPVAVWCNNRACGYWLQHGQQYRTVLTAADLASYAERYGAAVTFEAFRKRLRCRHCGSGDVSTIVNSHHETPGDRWERNAREEGTERKPVDPMAVDQNRAVTKERDLDRP